MDFQLKYSHQRMYLRNVLWTNLPMKANAITTSVMHDDVKHKTKYARVNEHMSRDQHTT